MNHVSTLTEDFNVTVARLQPMTNLTVKGVPDVVPQGSTQTLTTSVLIDMSVPATVRYEQPGLRRMRDVMFDGTSFPSTSVSHPPSRRSGRCSGPAPHLLPCS